MARRPVPRIVGEVDAAAGLRPAGEVLVEPTEYLVEIGRLLGRWVLGGGVAEVAEIELLGACEQLVRGDRLVDVEEEVVPPLEQERRHVERVELRPRGARRLDVSYRRVHRAAEQVVLHGVQRRIPLGGGYVLKELLQQPDLGHAVGVECLPEVGPRGHRHDRLERDAGDRRVPDLAAAERQAEGSDLGVRDVAARGEPVEEILRVLHVRRPVEPERATRGARAARVAGERGEAVLRKRAAVRLHVGVRLAEPVEEDHAGPAAGRGGAAGDDVRARERRRVGGVDRDLGPARRGRSAPGAHERCGEDGEDDPRPTHDVHASAHLRCPPWTRVRLVSSIPAWEG